MRILKRHLSNVIYRTDTHAQRRPRTTGLDMKVERVGRGFRRFTNYRLRVLLYTGVPNWALLGQ